ncbi:unnamed protein product [Timema podura]|uniref:Uncharacterized protein n=1 Tax=Timema podura TaxID=61482 RepID=A0ABN7PP19_TIMPD|nr:unnamed protein product [Timema podura]
MWPSSQFHSEERYRSPRRSSGILHLSL